MPHTPSLSSGAASALRLDTIKRTARALTSAQVFGLTNLRDGRNWDYGRGRAGGAVSRMFDRMESMGLVTSIPHRLTDFGRKVLAAKLETRKSE